MVYMVMGGESGSRSEKKTLAVKAELDDMVEEGHRPLNKRPRQSLVIADSTAPHSEYNPLNEPSPLGLRLRKSPSLLELIQMKLSEANSTKFGSQSHGKEELRGSAASGDKLKASNFPGSLLRIGNWEYKSRYEGDLVAKCYFAKHKLVWEVLDGGLKNKIEIQWSDITALKAHCPDDGPGSLDVVLSRQPLFFRETNPQPRKHTLWQATSDFTGGEATIHRRHYLESPQGLMGRHLEKLVQCDPRLYVLSQQGEITLDSPYFDCNHELDLNRDGSPSFLSLLDTASPFAHSSSSRNEVEAVAEFFSHETPSPSSAMQAPTMEDVKSSGFKHLQAVGSTVPGLHSSMSMIDLVSHLECRIAEQGSSSNPSLSSEDWEGMKILDDINRSMFSDSSNLPPSDDKSLMSRVNSLCCLLQRDSSAPVLDSGAGKRDEAEAMPRVDSVGELLLNLPRIASLPQFLFSVSENFESQAR